MGKGTITRCLLLALFLGCPGASERFVAPALAAEEGSFSGTWVANGSKEALAFGNERETALFKLSGVVHLVHKLGKESDFWADCIGLADSATGSDLRCVWRSMDGEEVYLILKGTRMERGSSITGDIVGGTGPAQGITGTLRFTWLMMSFKQESKEMGISGFSTDVNGSYRLP